MNTSISLPFIPGWLKEPKNVLGEISGVQVKFVMSLRCLLKKVWAVFILFSCLAPALCFGKCSIRWVRAGCSPCSCDDPDFVNQVEAGGVEKEGHYQIHANVAVAVERQQPDADFRASSTYASSSRYPRAMTASGGLCPAVTAVVFLWAHFCIVIARGIYIQSPKHA